MHGNLHLSQVFLPGNTQKCPRVTRSHDENPNRKRWSAAANGEILRSREVRPFLRC